MNDFIDSRDVTLRSFPEVEDMWAADGITAAKISIFYCGTGWRAALAFFDAYLMGWNHINVYDGGWYEWIMGPDAAINPMNDEYPDLPAK